MYSVIAILFLSLSNLSLNGFQCQYWLKKIIIIVQLFSQSLFLRRCVWGSLSYGTDTHRSQAPSVWGVLRPHLFNAGMDLSSWPPWKGQCCWKLIKELDILFWGTASLLAAQEQHFKPLPPENVMRIFKQKGSSKWLDPLFRTEKLKEVAFQGVFQLGAGFWVDI